MVLRPDRNSSLARILHPVGRGSRNRMGGSRFRCKPQIAASARHRLRLGVSAGDRLSASLRHGRDADGQNPRTRPLPQACPARRPLRCPDLAAAAHGRAMVMEVLSAQSGRSSTMAVHGQASPFLPSLSRWRGDAAIWGLQRNRLPPIRLRESRPTG